MLTTKRQSYWRHIENIIEIGNPDQEHQPKQKRLFNFIKSLPRDNRGIAPLKEKGRLHDDPKDKADILNRQYESTWTKEDKDDIPIPDGTPFSSMGDITVTEQGVVKLLLKLNERLLRKMDHYGVRGSTLEWIRAFLTDRVQQVTVEGATSDSIQVLSGVPQGTVLGPLLFLVFINNLPDCVESGIRLFADDCILYRCIKNQKDCDTLQQDLNNLAAWEKKWGMAFHPEKCSAIRVTRARKTISSSYTL